jgi:alkylation response protein AidB-like acyl-CoA dehydrogenase
MDDAIAVARRLADDLLFPDAMRVDGLDKLPAAHLDALAAAGLYGSGAPVQAGGLGLAPPALYGVTEELASGCLATAFVWIQHLGPLMTLAYAPVSAGLREAYLGPAIRGTLRGGIALAGQIAGPPLLRAEPAGDQWRLDGTAPWVTGWDGLTDMVLVAARGPGNTIVRLLMDATRAPGLTVTRQRLIAVNASVTVRLDFDGVMIPAARFVGQQPFDSARDGQLEGSRMNGSLALGLTRRCCRLLGPSPLDDQLAACRARLDEAVSPPAPAPTLPAAPAATMAAARAAASELAIRATAALAVHAGSKAITLDQHPQRLSREALFLLVFASRPAIKTELLHRLVQEPFIS